jgi:hypothetical protein
MRLTSRIGGSYGGIKKSKLVFLSSCSSDKIRASHCKKTAGASLTEASSNFAYAEA